MHIYDQLDGLRLKTDAGKQLKQTSAKAQWECEMICDRTLGCESFGFCPDSGCYLFDEIITKENQTKSDPCYTVFRTCDKGKVLVLC